MKTPIGNNGVTKSIREVTDKQVGFAGKTTEKLDFIRRHGTCPE